MNDRRNHHGAVDKPKLEQQFHKWEAVTSVVRSYFN